MTISRPVWWLAGNSNRSLHQFSIFAKSIILPSLLVRQTFSQGQAGFRRISLGQEKSLRTRCVLWVKENGVVRHLFWEDLELLHDNTFSAYFRLVLLWDTFA